MPYKTASIWRRKFAKLLGAGAACAVASPGIARTGSLFSGAETRPAAGFTNAANVVRLSANENPYGPSPMAIKAMTEAFSLSCRYPDDHAEVLIESLAKINGVSRDQILIADGSGEILKLCAAAFTGPMSAATNRAVELAPPSPRDA